MMSLISNPTQRSKGREWLAVYARALVPAVLFLLVAGAMVTSTGSGLAVPDWPLSFGKVMPPMQGGVFYEHGHRMVATAIGLLTILLAIWTSRVEPRAWVRRLTWGALGLVILQGVVGGMTVLLRLPVWTSALHACLAQGFFLVIVFLALAHSPSWEKRDITLSPQSHLPRLALLTTIAIYGQLVLGAVMRHMNAALAIPDFPTVFGGLFPPVWTPQILIHFAHRVGALIVTLLVFGTAVAARRAPRNLRTLALGMTLIVLVQVMLGASIIWTSRQVVVATVHVVVGAVLLACSMVLTVKTHRELPARRNAASTLFAPGEVPA
ncbi:MAG TPA: COX15/CtaA family protein [Dongiaceae bacterium]|nr:COX15/CtaA family protein [Dongiaceae bacterium]